jgi:hypothetical protein
LRKTFFHPRTCFEIHFSPSLSSFTRPANNKRERKYFFEVSSTNSEEREREREREKLLATAINLKFRTEKNLNIQACTEERERERASKLIQKNRKLHIIKISLRALAMAASSYVHIDANKHNNENGLFIGH